MEHPEVIMDVLVPTTSTNKVYKEQALLDFAHGIRTRGDNAVVVENFDMPDLHQLESNSVGVYYGALKPSRLSYDQRVQVKQLMHHFYKNCVVLETPLIDRTEPINTEFRVGVNGYLRNNAKWAWHDIDQDRVKKFYKNRKFNIDIEWSTDRGNDILLIMQNHDDLSTHGIDSFQWTIDTIKKLQLYSDRQIIVRSNPFHEKQETGRVLEFGEKLKRMKNVKFSYSGYKQPLQSITEQLNDAWCVVCHSSGSSFDAVIKGIPVICLDESCMAWDVCGHDLSSVENPVKPNTVPWFEKIAMIQYSIEEFRSGECWSYIRTLCL